MEMEIETFIRKIIGKTPLKFSMELIVGKDGKRRRKFEVYGYAIDHRIDNIAFKKLKKTLIEKFNWNAFGVMHKDDDWDAPLLLYDYQVSVNYWGILIFNSAALSLPSCGDFHCICDAEICNFSLASMA